MNKLFRVRTKRLPFLSHPAINPHLFFPSGPSINILVITLLTIVLSVDTDSQRFDPDGMSHHRLHLHDPQAMDHRDETHHTELVEQAEELVAGKLVPVADTVVQELAEGQPEGV